MEKARQAAEKAQKEQAEKEAREAEAAKAAAAQKAQKAEKASQAAAAQEKAQAESATQQAAKASESSSKPAASTSQQSTTKASEQPAQASTQPTAPTTPTTSGRTIQMESTGYSYAEAVNTFFTATGIDLRQNPMVVAVDPSVIPLGSIVEVSGYGIAIAGDTGGAIKGNIVDCHFPTVEQCIQWGRRSVTVTVMS